LACIIRNITDRLVDSDNAASPQAYQTHHDEGVDSATDPLLNLTSQSLATYDQVIREKLDRHQRTESQNTRKFGIHPLERSLGKFVDALERVARTSDSGSDIELSRAGESMSRIVDSALIGIEGDFVGPERIATDKLLQAIQIEAAAHSGRREVLIDVDPDALPPEIWVRTELLVAGLSSLFDSACSTAASSTVTQLSIVTSAEPETNSWIEFVVDTLSKSSLDQPCDQTNPNDESTEKDANSSQIEALYEAIASDVAKAHDGELIIERREGGYVTKRLRIANVG